jgi:hypothetical protein
VSVDEVVVASGGFPEEGAVFDLPDLPAAVGLDAV